MMMFSRQTSNAVFAGDFTHIPGKQISLTFFKFLTFFVLFISMQILTFALVIFLEEKNALRLFTEKKMRLYIFSLQGHYGHIKNNEVKASSTHEARFDQRGSLKQQFSIWQPDSFSPQLSRLLKNSLLPFPANNSQSILEIKEWRCQTREQGLRKTNSYWKVFRDCEYAFRKLHPKADFLLPRLVASAKSGLRHRQLPQSCPWESPNRPHGANTYQSCSLGAINSTEVLPPYRAQKFRAGHFQNAFLKLFYLGISKCSANKWLSNSTRNPSLTSREILSQIVSFNGYPKSSFNEMHGHLQELKAAPRLAWTGKQAFFSCPPQELQGSPTSGADKSLKYCLMNLVQESYFSEAKAGNSGNLHW